MRFCISVSDEIVEDLLVHAEFLKSVCDLMVSPPGFPEDIQTRLGQAIIEGISRKRNAATFRLPEDKHILACFEVEAQRAITKHKLAVSPRWRDSFPDRGTLGWQWTRVLGHCRKALKSARRPWLIQLADCANGS